MSNSHSNPPLALDGSRKSIWTNERIFEEIRLIAVDGTAKCTSASPYLRNIARKKFGSWASACLAAGVAPNGNMRVRWPVSSSDGICVIPGCGSETVSGSCPWCMKHYTRYLRHGDALSCAADTDYTLNESLYDGEWSDSSAWLLGVLWTDGWMKGNTVGIKSKDADIIEYVRHALGTNKAIKQCRTQGRRYQQVQVTCRTLSDSLRRIGMHEAKTFSILYPVGLPDEFFWPFFRGVMDGDGCVRRGVARKGQRIDDCWISIITASHAFAVAIHERLLERGLAVAMRERPENQERGRISKCWTIHINEIRSVRKAIRLLYPKADVACCHRKRDRLLGWARLRPHMHKSKLFLSKADVQQKCLDLQWQ